ncbi:MAG TPA: phosphatase PAP2 family protein [Steroidobacteraceae bacterium]|jgi:acid phosphatase (class A)|nr:phosphatase PAP2 family protein [Steroidobacteraceae bacterium]
MKFRSARLTAAIAFALAVAATTYWRSHHDRPAYLSSTTADFVAIFAAPPARGSAATLRELDELLAMQQRRSPRDVEAARADRRTDVWQFAAALGLPRERVQGLRELGELAERVENDERPYVRAAKDRFRRLRPYEIEPRLEPCIDDVRGDLSYPSGHATYGYLIAYLLIDMVPERRAQIAARAQEFARQRLVCGVHFPSDLEAGRVGAEWLARRFEASPEYRADATPAARELRSALGLPP